MNKALFFSGLTTAFLAIACSPHALAQSLTNPTKLYTGTIYTAGTNDLAGEGMLYVFEDPYEESPVTSSRINATAGGYRVLLDPAKLYWFRIEALGFYTDDFMVSSPPGEDYEERVEDLRIRPIPIDSLLFRGAPFEGETALFSDNAPMRNVLEFLVDNPTVVVEIGVGLEADEVDPVTKKRVNAIKKLFREMDVSTTRIAWTRKLDDPFGTITISIDSFAEPEESDY